MGVIAEEEEDDGDEAWDDMGGGPGEDIGAVDDEATNGSKHGEQ